MQQGHHRIHLSGALEFTGHTIDRVHRPFVKVGITSDLRSGHRAERISKGAHETDPLAVHRSNRRVTYVAQQSVRRLIGGRRVGAQPVDAVAGISDTIVEIGDTAVELMVAYRRNRQSPRFGHIQRGLVFSTADSYGEPPTKSPVDTGIILPGLWLSATVKAVALSAPRSICP